MERPLHKGQNYYYLREEIETREILSQYLSPVFMREAIEQGIYSLGLIEHRGRLALLDMYRRPLLHWEDATLFLLEDSYEKIEHSLHVPHDELYSRIFLVQFKGVPQIGWRIDTSLDTFFLMKSISTDGSIE